MCGNVALGRVNAPMLDAVSPVESDAAAQS
ncbi:hypothetical protein ACVWY3_004781 [Bradyrhizobium sp. USDA 4486]